LEAQTWVRSRAPNEIKGITLVTLEELQEIRRIWVVDKHEIEDSLPRIYADVTGEPYPGTSLNEHPTFAADDVALLKQLCGGNGLHFEMTRELLDLEQQHRTMLRRAGLLTALDDAITKSFFDGEEDATAHARTRRLDAVSTEPDEAGG
jgi:DNA sulfur modification protein DndC